MQVAVSSLGSKQGARTVIDDVPRFWHQAAGLSGKGVIARARRAESIAVQLWEAELGLQIVCRQRRQRAAQAMSCARASDYLAVAVIAMAPVSDAKRQPCHDTSRAVVTWPRPAHTVD